MLMSVLGISAQKSWIFSDAAFLGEASTVEFTEETTINGLTIVPAAEGTEAGKGVVIDANNKTVDGVKYTHRLKTGGSATATNRLLRFAVDGPTKITVVLMSGSGSNDRTLNICKDAYDKDNPIGTMPALGATCEKVSYNYTGEAATIVLGSHSSGINIYAIYTEPLTIYSIVGDFSGGWENDIDMVESEDNPNVYTLTIENFNVDKDFYEYKLRTNHAWGGYELPGDGTNQNWKFDNADYPHGLYNLTFTANIAENTLELVPVMAPPPTSIDINVTDEVNDGTVNYMTYSSPYALDFTNVEGIKAYVGKKSTDSYGELQGLVLTPVEKVPAGTGLLIKAEAAGTYTIPVADSAEPVENDMVVADADIDLYDAVQDDWGMFAGGPTILKKDNVLDYTTYTYADVVGFIPPAKPDAAGTDILPAGTVYVPVESTEVGWTFSYVQLIFTDVELPIAENIAALRSIESGTDVKLTLNATVVAQNNSGKLVIQDETGGILVQDPDMFVINGDKLTGTYTTTYNSVLYPQLMANSMTSSTDYTATEGTPVEAQNMSMTDAFVPEKVWSLVKLEKVTVSMRTDEYGSTAYYIADADGAEVQLQDFVGVGFSISGLNDGDVIDIEGFPVILDENNPYYENLYWFSPISYTLSQEEEKQVAVITFGNAEPGRDYISDPFMVNGVTNLEADLKDGTHMLFNFESEMNPNGKFWAAGIDGEWNNSAAVAEMNTALNTGFENSDFAAGSPLQASNPGPGDSHANLILTFNNPAKKTLELYVTMTGRNGPLDAVKVTGLDSYNISYAVGDGDGFVSEPTFSQKILGVTLIKIKGYLIEGQSVTVTSLSMAGENSAKCGFQMAGYTFTDEELPFVINSMAVVGTFPGMTWEPTEGIAMTQDPENAALWTVTMEGVAVEAMQYEYKATANGRWGAYELPMEGNQNFVFGTEEYPAGNYDLTFTADTENNTLTLDVATPVSAIENIAALKAFEGEDGSYILKLNNALVTYSNTFEDEDYFGNVETKDYAIIEDETAAYVFPNLGLGAKFAAGTILNGELAVNVSSFFGMGVDITANEQTPASVEALQTSEGTVEPLLVTEENLDAYAENFDWHQAKFEGVTIRAEEGSSEGVYEYHVTIPVLGNEYGVLDLCGAITEWPETTEPLTMIGYIFDYFGTQYLQPIEFIPAEKKQVAVITFGNAEPGRDYISDPFMVNGVTNLETDLVDGTHMLFNFDSEMNPNGKFWAAGIDGEWNNSAAVAEMNTALNTGFENSDFAAGSPLQASNPGPGDSHANLILTFNNPAKKTLELYVTMTGRNGPLDAVKVTGLDSYNISYAVGDGDGFVSEPTFSQKILGVTLIKIKGYLIEGQSVTVTSLSMAGENSAKCGFQMAGYTFTDEELPFVINSMAVVGTFPGMTWEPTEGIAMTQDPENAALWTVTMEGVAVEAMQYEYKATANGRWGAYELPMEGNQNFVFGTEEYPAGNYDLTFTADTENNLLTIDVKPSVVTGINAVSIDWNDGNTYNLNGQRLTKPVKGIVIRNGKKMVVK